MLFDTDIDDILSENAGSYTVYFDIDELICGCTLAVEIFNENMDFTLEDNGLETMAEGELELF